MMITKIRSSGTKKERWLCSYVRLRLDTTATPYLKIKTTIQKNGGCRILIAPYFLDDEKQALTA